MPVVSQEKSGPDAVHVHLPFLSFNLEALVATSVAGEFGEFGEIFCGFVSKGPLSCGHRYGARRAVILLHDVLNHESTPPEVVEYLVKHELLHFRHAPQPTGDGLLRHTEPFRTEEKSIAPGRLLAWTWLYVNLGTHLRVRPQAERIDVASTWKAAWHLDRLDLHECARRRNRYRRPARLYV